MDNCVIHHDEEIRAIIEGDCGTSYCPLFEYSHSDRLAGAKLVYLPPYSPDLNPIEQAFHSIKS
jgi:transposase